MLYRHSPNDNLGLYQYYTYDHKIFGITNGSYRLAIYSVFYSVLIIKHNLAI